MAFSLASSLISKVSGNRRETMTRSRAAAFVTSDEVSGRD